MNVKKLEWTEEYDGWWSAMSHAFPLGYEMRVTDRGGVRVRLTGNSSWQPFDGSETEAKKYIQDEYAARVLSCLDTPSHT